MQKHALLVFLMIAAQSMAQEALVIGSDNQDLVDGAAALEGGDAAVGVKLTLAGLEKASSKQERLTANANLCAGYVLLNKMVLALTHCDQALALNERHWRSLSNRALIYVRMGRLADAREDLDRGQQISPNAKPLKDVRALLRDAATRGEPETTTDDFEPSNIQRLARL